MNKFKILIISIYAKLPIKLNACHLRKELEAENLVLWSTNIQSGPKSKPFYCCKLQ